MAITRYAVNSDTFNAILKLNGINPDTVYIPKDQNKEYLEITNLTVIEFTVEEHCPPDTLIALSEDGKVVGGVTHCTCLQEPICNPDCEFFGDSYNTDGDCLANK